MRAELWFFQDNHGIDVLDMYALFVEKFLRVLQEFQAVGVFPPRIAVRKMSADVTERRCAEHSVTQGVSENVTIGMADGTFSKWNGNTADDEKAPFRKAVQVVADSAAHCAHA
jgi:hypothetical protein